MISDHISQVINQENGRESIRSSPESTEMND